MERARRLVVASRTKGTRVTVWVQDFSRRLGNYFVSLLRDLGYASKLKTLGDDYSNTIADSRTRAQISAGGWVPDYPAPSGFIEPFLTCDSHRPHYTENENTGGFCDARVDALIARAGKLQTSDPAAARRLWTRIDAEIVDRAALVPLINPRSLVFLSERAGNYHFGATGAVWEQLWVR